MVPGRPRTVARVSAAVVLMLLPAMAVSQTLPAEAPPPADPAADLAPLPDLGVDWPDPAQIDAAAPAPAPDRDAPPPAKGVPVDQLQRYRVVLEGADSLGEVFRTRFDQLSTLKQNEGKPANAAQLDRRAKEDETLIGELLRAEGYYDGRVSSSITSGAGGAVVRLAIRMGSQPYRFSAVTLPGLEAAGDAAPELARAFTIKAGDPVDADQVLAATVAFRTAIGREGYPFAKIDEPKVTIDHATDQATLALAVDPGPRAQFGRIVPAGPRPLFSARHLGEIARFRAGQRYDAAKLEDFRRALIATGLVSSATITPVRTANAGVVDIEVKLDRAPPRTIAGELGYGTGEGARAEISWQHRNLIKPEGAVTFRGVVGTREQSLSATLRKSNASARDRIFNAQVSAAHSNLNAYDARTFSIGANLERQTNIIWQKKWSWSIGAEFLASDERDTVVSTGEGRRRTFLVAAAPSSLTYDGSDDLLNPSRGFRLSGRVSPEFSLQSGAKAYLKLQIDASGYQPVGSRIVLAGRVRVGSIQGVSRDSIAPSRRFYAGGGGSIRGYSYQKVGPIDVNGDPIGGRGLTEFGTEARFRFGAFGVVPFLDAGRLSSASTPRFTDLRFGTGLGVRYYSSFGPIRVDVGTPLNRRPGESRIAVYVALGQAF